jgi:hypothetical protein
VIALVQRKDYLRKNDVSDNQIVSVNFEELEYEELLDYKKLYAYLKEHLVQGRPPTSFWMKSRRCLPLKKWSTAFM